jgi:hypothetical protein
VDRSDLAGIVGQDAGRPQRIAEVVTPDLQLRGKATIQGMDLTVEEGVEGTQM